uniref:CUB domain-containing protein n=1 Tax=Timema bartmani TaxID=61472 RepID=A0A7R9FA47_9NEOP|nr:unnamed protein product [Timema bartmani]
MFIVKLTSDHEMGPLWVILLSTPLIISACFLPEALLSSNKEKAASLPEINSTYDACTNSIHNLDVDSRVVTRDGYTNSINNLDGEHKFLDTENDPNINPIQVSDMKFKAVTQDENANITQIRRSDMKSKALIFDEDTDIPKHYSNMKSRDVLQDWDDSTPPIQKSPVKSRRNVLQDWEADWEASTPPIQKSPVKSRDVLQDWEASTPPIQKSPVKSRDVLQDWEVVTPPIQKSPVKSRDVLQDWEASTPPIQKSPVKSRDVLQDWEAGTPPIQKSPVKFRDVLQDWEASTPPIQKSPVKSRDVLQDREAGTPPIQKSPVKSRAVPLVWNELAESKCSQVLYVGSSQQVEFYFPSSYPRNSYCIIILRGPMGHKLVLMLMDTRTGDQLSSCDQDAVQVYSLNQGLLTFKDQLCNGSSPGVVTDGNIALLTFNTAQESTRGFNVNLQIVSNSAVDNTNTQYQYVTIIFTKPALRLFNTEPKLRYAHAQRKMAQDGRWKNCPASNR